MNGYIIVAESEETEVSDKYWNGTVFENDIEQAKFITTKVDARNAVGNLQAKNRELDIRLVPAQIKITLGHVTSEDKSISTTV